VVFAFKHCENGTVLLNVGSDNTHVKIRW